MDLLAIIGALGPLLIAYIAYNEQEKKSMKARMSKLVDRKDVESMIEDKTQVLNVQIQELKEDIKDIKGTTDKVLDILLANKNH